jgi:hypothetical protein
MTTAPENRGGDRPTASQNNPANISATGGAGGNGTQAPKYIPGMKSLGSTGVETMAQQGAAALAGDPVPSVPPVQTPAGNPMASMMSGLVPLDAESMDDLPISDGVDIGRGRGSDALNPRLTSPINQDENVALIKRYLPDLMNATRLPGAPDSYKQFINYLKNQII